MGIADAAVDMTLQSAAPATILIAKAFTGHLPLLVPVPKKPANPNWRARYHGRRPAGGHEALKTDYAATREDAMGAKQRSKGPILNEKLISILYEKLISTNEQIVRR
jgi:hypothetical protein